MNERQLSSWAKSKALACSHNYRNKQDNFIIAFYYYHRVLLVIMDAIIMYWLNKQSVTSIVCARICVCASVEHVSRFEKTHWTSHRHHISRFSTVTNTLGPLSFSFAAMPQLMCLFSALFRAKCDCSRANMQTIRNGCGFQHQKYYYYVYFVSLCFLFSLVNQLAVALFRTQSMLVFYDVCFTRTKWLWVSNTLK